MKRVNKLRSLIFLLTACSLLIITVNPGQAGFGIFPDAVTADYETSRLTTAELSELETRASFRSGFETDDKFHLNGLNIGVYRDNYPERLPLLGNAASFIIWGLDHIVEHKEIDWGLEFTANHISDEAISNRYDYSAIFLAEVSLTDRIFYTVGVGPAYNRLRGENRDGLSLGLGSRWFFAPEIKFGYRFNWDKNRYNVHYVWMHRSNGDIANRNQSLNFHGIALGTTF